MLRDELARSGSRRQTPTKRSAWLYGRASWQISRCQVGRTSEADTASDPPTATTATNAIHSHQRSSSLRAEPLLILGMDYVPRLFTARLFTAGGTFTTSAHYKTQQLSSHHRAQTPTSLYTSSSSSSMAQGGVIKRGFDPLTGLPDVDSFYFILLSRQRAAPQDTLF